eukprot:TRINITY_DN7144_c0_g1_i2.p1 TRINITY_DN7144_c0_g1~~TRINITY_DN7144_c0_g1_i2.p1  ORF type:complete len:745 (-),score=144.72 TRINITY_DN7144_c0_g1_i2:95-2287(-)
MSTPTGDPPVGSASASASNPAGNGAVEAGDNQESTAPTFTLLFASQTGTAESIAEKLEEDAPIHGFKADVYSMDDYLKQEKDITQENLVVIVSSSTGDGDPPDNGAKFYKLVKRRSNPSDWLSGVRFAILGLGDTNYSSFNQVPRTFEKRMKACGAQEFYQRGEADDATGLEAVVEPWIAGLWPALDKAFQCKPSTSSTATSTATTTAASAGVVGAISAPGAGKGTPLADVTAPADLNPSSLRVVYRDTVLPGNGSEVEVDQPTDSQAWQTRCAQLEAVARASLDRQPVRAHALDSSYCRPYSQFSPFRALVQSSQQLTSDDAEKTTLFFSISIANSGLAYLPGDSVAVCCPNDPDVVNGLLEKLGLDGDAVVCVAPSTHFGDHPDSNSGKKRRAVKLGRHLQGFFTIRELLETRVDLNAPPKKLFFKNLAFFATDEGEKERLEHFGTAAGTPAYKEYIAGKQPTVLDVLADFPSACPTIELLAEHLQPQQPRHFSICSSQRVTADTIEFAITLVNWPGVQRRGLASGYLERVHRDLQASSSSSSSTVSIFIAPPPAQRFRPPSDLQVPIILVGPGTGITPFRSFLLDREAQAREHGDRVQSGPCLTYCGCRDKQKDYLFGKQLDAWAQSGLITHHRVAESRASQGADMDTSKRTYVQHLMEQDMNTLGPLLAEGQARLYVCGNGSVMAKEVHDCLSHILQRTSNMSSQEANMHLQSLVESDKYVRDVWH